MGVVGVFIALLLGVDVASVWFPPTKTGGPPMLKVPLLPLLGVLAGADFFAITGVNSIFSAADAFAVDIADGIIANGFGFGTNASGT